MGIINGYSDTFIKNIIKKHIKKNKLKIITKLEPITIYTPTKIIKITYFPKWTNKLENTVKSSNSFL